MAIEISMPKLSDTMEEGKIIKWLVSEGDTVNSGDLLAEIETDKADMEYETIEEGTLLKILVGEGETAPVGQLIAVIGEEGEDIGDIGSSSEKAEADSPVVQADTSEEPAEATEEEQPEPEEPKKAEPAKEKPAEKPKVKPASGGAVKASPVARRLADAAGVDISEIPGSGPDGRVVKRDVEQFVDGDLPKLEPAAKPEPKPADEPKKPAGKPAAAPTPQPAQTITLEGRREAMSGMRKTIAKRLVQSKVEVPHFYLMVDVDAEPLLEARAQMNALGDIKLSVNDFIIKACATALLRHPMVNAHVDGDDIVYNDSVDIGMAVAIDQGLITPYIRRAHEKTIAGISTEARELAERARERKLKPEEYSGGSFTVSNLGMFGIDRFTAIINPPESTILAVGSAKEVPVVRDGMIVPGMQMTLTLSCDHRIVDGATGAQFMQTLQDILENPLRMLL